MSLDNETVDGTESHDNSGQDKSGNEPALRAEIEQLRSFQEQMMNKLESLTATQTQHREQPKQLSVDEYKKLLEDDPKAAVAYALDGQVNARAQQIEAALTAKQQQGYFDQKMQNDFPLFTTDKKFQTLAQTEARNLIADGMSKDSPKLMYKAAEIAALKYGVTQKKTESSGSMSSEAPNNVSKKQQGSNNNLPSNFDKMAKMFNMSDKAIERFKKNAELTAKAEAHRKNRGN